MNQQKQLLITNTAKKHLSKLPQKIKNKILTQLETLKDNPLLLGDIKPLQGLKDNITVYRLRVGEYRVLFKLESDIIITILDVGTHNIEYRL